MRGTLERARVELAERLRERRGEIEAALLTRTYAIADPTEAADPEYAQGLRAAVSAALEYATDALEKSEERAPSIPMVLLAQARLAARSRVPLETVLRRYFAGYTLLSDFLIEEAEHVGISSGPLLKRLLRVQATLFDQLTVAVTEEYGRETALPESSSERRTHLIKRLLDGELADTSELAYGFDGWHLGMVLTGDGVAEFIRRLADLFDCRFLSARPREGATWAWLGRRSRLNPREVIDAAVKLELAGVALAIGEPAEDIAGWRLTHRQADVALPIAQSGATPVRYSEVALLASILQDDLLSASLQRLYLTPLESDRDGGELARETLQAYFESSCNLSSAAAVLGVTRQTVARRLRHLEERFERNLDSSALEIEAALRLYRFSHGQPKALRMSQDVASP